MRVRLLQLAALLWLCGCAALDGPRTIEVSRAQLEEQIARQFPFRSRFLELLDVTVSAPRLSLMPEANRIATALEVSTGEPLTGRSWHGALLMNYRLRFEPADNTVRLAEVRVERFRIDGLPSALQPKVSLVGSMLAEELLKNQPVHTLKAEDVQRMQARGLMPGELVITSNGLSIPLKGAK